MQKHFASFAAGQISFREHRLRRIREIFRTSLLPLPEEETDAIFQEYLQHYEASWSLFEDVLPCLESLKKRKLGIISNGNGEQQRRKIGRLGIQDRFTTIVVSEEVRAWKPKPEIFLEACRQASAAPRDCFYVGDNFTADAQASQTAGMRGIWLNRNHAPAPEVNVPVIHSLTGVEAALSA